jgi:hypothetical protein
MSYHRQYPGWGRPGNLLNIVRLLAADFPPALARTPSRTQGAGDHLGGPHDITGRGHQGRPRHAGSAIHRFTVAPEDRERISSR